MVEILGFMDGFLNQLPQLLIVQSFFKDSLTERPYDDGFLDQLFPKERTSLSQLTSFKHILPGPRVSIPKSVVFGPENVTATMSILCDVHNENTVIKEGFAIHGGDMLRPLYPGASDPESCCSACASQPLCIAWSFENGICVFKGADRGK